MALVQRIQPLQRAVDIDRRVPSRLADETDDPLRLAKGIGADQVAALRELRDGPQQAGDLVVIRRMAEDRQAEGGLADKDITGHRLEQAAGGIAAALVIAGDDDGHAFPGQSALRRAQYVPGGVKDDFDLAARERRTIGGGFGSSGKIRPITYRHDRQCFLGRQHRAMAAAGMVAMAVGDDGAVHRADGINIEIAGRAIKPGWCGPQQVGEFHGRILLRGRLALSPSRYLCHDGNAGACCRFLYGLRRISLGARSAADDAIHRSAIFPGGKFVRAIANASRQRCMTIWRVVAICGGGLTRRTMLPLALEFLYKVPVSFWPHS